MKIRYSIIFSSILLITVSRTVPGQSSDNDPSLERKLYTFASNRSEISFGESGLRLCAVPMKPGQSAMVVYWDSIDDYTAQAKIGFFDHQKMVEIKINEISDLGIVRTEGIYPSLAVREQIKASRHTFETREELIPAEWIKLLKILKEYLDQAEIDSHESIECAWLIDQDLDDNGIPDVLSLLIKCRTDEDHYILVRPKFGKTDIEIVTSRRSTVTISTVKTIKSLLLDLPDESISFLAVAPGRECTWAALGSNPDTKISYDLDDLRERKLDALSNGNAPGTKGWSCIRPKLKELTDKKVLRIQIDEKEFCRWLISYTGPNSRRPIDPAILLLE